jgi:hypothetical protein
MTAALPCPESLLPFVYRWSRTHIDLVAAETLPELGVDLLAAGFDTPEVVRLAVCDRTDHPDDLRKAAGRAFKSLGFGFCDAGIHEIIVGTSVARRIVDSSVAPEDGLGEMVRLWRITCHSKRFEDWMFLGEAIYLFRDGYGGIEPFMELTEDSIPVTIRSLARLFLTQHPILYQP